MKRNGTKRTCSYKAEIRDSVESVLAQRCRETVNVHRRAGETWRCARVWKQREMSIGDTTSTCHDYIFQCLFTLTRESMA